MENALVLGLDDLERRWGTLELFIRKRTRELRAPRRTAYPTVRLITGVLMDLGLVQLAGYGVVVSTAHSRAHRAGDSGLTMGRLR
jgi:hypothetical protein